MRKRAFRLCMAFLVMALVPLAATAQERSDFFKLWLKHVAGTNLHEQVIGNCQSYLAQYPEGRLTPLVRGLEAWRRLQLGQRKEAHAIWEGQLLASGVASRATVKGCADSMARAWLTRLDQESIEKKLRAFYLKNVRYPAALDSLWQEDDALMRTDRWGDPWHYRLGDFSKLKGFHGQRYVLYSRTLGPKDDLAVAWVEPLGVGLPYRVVRVTRTGRAGATVVLKDLSQEGKSLTLAVGAVHGALVLLDAGEDFVIVSEPLRWGVLPVSP